MGRIGSGPTLCAVAALLAGCGGDDGGSGPPVSSNPVPSATATPAPSTAACSLATRKEWVRAALDEWYLFPENLDLAVNASAHGTMEAYVDALVAPARALNKDRYFTYVASIAEENAYYEQGASAGFGMRLAYDYSVITVLETYENSPAAAAGIVRGDRITAIGNGGSLRTVLSLTSSGGGQALVDALGPDTVGTTRTLRISSQSGAVRELSLTKADFALDPVSDLYGVNIFTEGSRRIGYLNLRTFIVTAEPDLRAAFARFKAQGVTELIIDLRYNGGGLISTAQVLGNLLAADKAGQPFGRITYRQSKSAENESFSFQPPAEAIAATRIAFLTTRSTASASELVINAMVPYLGRNMAIVGTDTYGKPVGQIALDNPGCGDRLRAVALRTENSAGVGDYYNGLARHVSVSCHAPDIPSIPLGDTYDTHVTAALSFLRGGSCNPISMTATATASAARTGTAAEPQALVPAQPSSTYQRELPGAF